LNIGWSGERTDKAEEDSSSATNETWDLYSQHPLHGYEHSKLSWYKALCDGNFYCEVDRIRNKVVIKEESDSGNRKGRHNYLRVNARGAVNSLIKEQPLVVGVPVGNDNEDKDVASLVTKALESVFFGINGVISKEFDVLWNAYRFGTGYFYVPWDPEKKAYIITKDLKTGKTRVVERERGDYKIKVLDDFSVFPYPYPEAKEVDEIEGYIISDVISLRKAFHLYPKFKDKIQAYSAVDEVKQKKEQYSPHINIEGLKRDECLRLTRWEKPSENYPKGRLVVVINENVEVKNGVNPRWKFGEHCLPIVPVYWDKTADDFRGRSGLKDGIPIQLDINDINTIKIRNLRNAETLYLVPGGMQLKPKRVPGVGKVASFNPNSSHPPVAQVANILPSHVSDYGHELRTVMNDMNSTQAASFGKLGARQGGVSARALSMLMEAETTLHNHNLERFKKSLIQLAWVIIKLMREYYTQKRLIRISGRASSYQVTSFAGVELEHPFDIGLRVGSVYDRQPAAKADLALQLWDRQIIESLHNPDPSIRNSAAQILRTIEFGEFNEITGLDELHEAYANWSLKTIISHNGDMAVIPQANVEFEDPWINELVFTRYALGEEFRDQPPMIRSAIIERIKIYKQKQQEISQQGQGGGQPLTEVPPGSQDQAEGQPPVEEVPGMAIQ
jgi:hypothetical protein